MFQPPRCSEPQKLQRDSRSLILMGRLLCARIYQCHHRQHWLRRRSGNGRRLATRRRLATQGRPGSRRRLAARRNVGSATLLVLTSRCLLRSACSTKASEVLLCFLLTVSLQKAKEWMMGCQLFGGMRYMKEGRVKPCCSLSRSYLTETSNRFNRKPRITGSRHGHVVCPIS